MSRDVEQGADFFIIRLKDECEADPHLATDTAAKFFNAGAKFVTMSVEDDGTVVIRGWRDTPPHSTIPTA